MKIYRHSKILEIIERQEIETQEELAEELIKEGIKVTQATVSRDIRTLRLTKTPSSAGKFHYIALPLSNSPNATEDRYIRILKEGFVSIERAGHILVLKTVPGMAMASAAALDAIDWPEIAGCIAGDDTIFCAIKSEEDVTVVMEKIRRITL
jgi:transcriptional regulator of arginine metabolism